MLVGCKRSFHRYLPFGHPVFALSSAVACFSAVTAVAFQMDGDYAQQLYDVWLDNVTLTAF